MVAVVEVVVALAADEEEETEGLLLLLLLEVEADPDEASFFSSPLSVVDSVSITKRSLVYTQISEAIFIDCGAEK